MKETKWIPLAERAKREGKAYQTIRGKVVRGTLERKKINGVWHVPDEHSIETTIEPEAQSQELNELEQPNENMALQALSSFNESAQSFQAMLQAKDEAHREEARRLNEQLQAEIRGKRWHLPAVVVAMLFVGVAGGLFVWLDREEVAKKVSEVHQSQVSRLVDGLRRHEAKIESLQADQLNWTMMETKLSMELQLERDKLQEALAEAQEAQKQAEKLRHDLEVMTHKAESLEGAQKASANVESLSLPGNEVED